LDPSEVVLSEKKDPVAECTDPDFIDLLAVAADDVASWDKVC